jgi:phage-related protein
MGDSLKQVRTFPEEVRREIGVALYDAQTGGKSPDAKPFKGVGSGVLEIVTRFATDTYRTVYAVQIGARLYVLHAFQKKATRGSKTLTRLRPGTNRPSPWKRRADHEQRRFCKKQRQRLRGYGP